MSDSASTAPASTTESASATTSSTTSSASTTAAPAASTAAASNPFSFTFGSSTAPIHNPFALSSTQSSFASLSANPSSAAAAPAASSDSTETEKDGEGGKDEAVSGADSTAEYTPVVKLEIIETATGEENEETIYKHRCALYRFAMNIDGNALEWKERGKGDVRLQKNKTSGKIRVLLRQEKTLKVCLNHPAYPELNLTPNAGSDRSWTWRCLDFSGDNAEGEVQTFALKFKDSETAAEFLKEFKAGQKVNADIAAKEKDTKTA